MTVMAYSDYPDFVRAVHRAIGQGAAKTIRAGNLTVKGSIGAWIGAEPKVANIDAQEAIGYAYEWLSGVRTQLVNEANTARSLGRDNAYECGYAAAIREAMGILLTSAATTIGEEPDPFHAYDAANPKARHPDRTEPCITLEGDA